MSEAQRHRLIFALIMSLLMTFFMTGWVTWINIGFTPIYFQRWATAFVGAWPAAFTIVMIIGPSVQRLTHFIVLKTHKPKLGHKNG